VTALSTRHRVGDRRRLTFYFDYISHNAYLAWSQLGSLAERHELAVDLVPVLFAAMLNTHGQLGPAEIPAKSAWMARDVIRKAIRLGIPLTPPASHPFNPLLALRVSSLPLVEEERPRLVRALFEATWARGLDVSAPEVVADVAGELGMDGLALVAEAGSQSSKERLREQTTRAIEAGAFGVPSMVVGEELFWGFDDLPHLELYLRGEDPLGEVDWEPWLGVRPSARRIG
jgi:2-hydroxychromene-2-carboxylate isomerase